MFSAVGGPGEGAGLIHPADTCRCIPAGPERGRGTPGGSVPRTSWGRAEVGRFGTMQHFRISVPEPELLGGVFLPPPLCSGVQGPGGGDRPPAWQGVGTGCLSAGWRTGWVTLGGVRQDCLSGPSGEPACRAQAADGLGENGRPRDQLPGSRL